MGAIQICSMTHNLLSLRPSMQLTIQAYVTCDTKRVHNKRYRSTSLTLASFEMHIRCEMR